MLTVVVRLPTTIFSSQRGIQHQGFRIAEINAETPRNEKTQPAVGRDIQLVFGTEL
jgi:hypothetical protein